MTNVSVNLQVRMERQAIAANRWATHQWVVAGLLPDNAELAPGDDARLFGPFEVRLFP